MCRTKVAEKSLQNIVRFDINVEKTGRTTPCRSVGHLCDVADHVILFCGQRIKICAI